MDIPESILAILQTVIDGDEACPDRSTVVAAHGEAGVAEAIAAGYLVDWAPRGKPPVVTLTPWAAELTRSVIDEWTKMTPRPSEVVKSIRIDEKNKRVTPPPLAEDEPFWTAPEKVRPTKIPRRRFEYAGLNGMMLARLTDERNSVQEWREQQREETEPVLLWGVEVGRKPKEAG